MQDVVAELLRAPVWVQVPLAALAVGMAVFLIVPGMQRRRYSRQFVALARGFERGVVPGEASFSALAAGRCFEISHIHRSGTGSLGTMRGPRGTLLMTTTPLSSPRWELHGVDIVRGARLRRAFGHALLTTGDHAFDQVFAVSEDGVAVRPQWLDRATRQAIVDFYAHPAARGTIWIQEGRLSHLLGTPWRGVNAGSLRTLLEKQAALADALDRTASQGF